MQNEKKVLSPHLPWLLMLTHTYLILGDSKMQPGIVEEHGHETVSLRHQTNLNWHLFQFNDCICFVLLLFAE